MPTGDIHKFGTLYINDVAINLNEEIPSYNDYPFNSKIEIRDTLEDDAYVINWVEVNYSDDKYYVCKSNLIKNICWVDLNKSNCIYPHNIEIDEINYIFKTLSGYNQTNAKENDWDMFICNGINSDNLPTVNIYDEASINNHNLFWNWRGIASITDSGIDEGNTLIACRGNYSYDYLIKYSSSIRNIENGWRPILMLNNNMIIPLKENATVSEINSYVTEVHIRLSNQIQMLRNTLTNKGIDCSNLKTLSQLIDKVRDI